MRTLRTRGACSTETLRHSTASCGDGEGRLVNLAWRFCRDRSQAEDLAQDAFVKAFRALGAYRGESAFSTWLTAIALNTFRSALRNRGPAPVVVEPEPADGRPSALARLVAQERSSVIRRLVATLPARYRDPLLLYYFEEMNLAETSRVLRIPEGTLKARLHPRLRFVGCGEAAARISDAGDAGLSRRFGNTEMPG